ncbi:glycoside hydrolase family 15 protein [Micromonospora sp. NBC_00389]|uniref:glycoside hydrolase family 15 protein n=1 Tax=Micromonospora sp. NBC_00389 TaxID=2903586 RepID=UPI003FA575EE
MQGGVGGPPIADYGFLSDCRSAALVSRDGSVDWWCPARFDSPSVFGRILDSDAGHWVLRPSGERDGRRIERAYIGDSLVLRTVHQTDGGSVAVTEALATEPGARGHDLGSASPAVLLRTVEGLSGRVRMSTDFVPRPEYGLLTPFLHSQPDRVVAAAGPVSLTLRAGVPLTCERGRAHADFDVSAGQVVGFDLAYAPSFGGPPAAELDPVAAIAETVEAWQVLQDSHHYDGRYPDLVRRSSVILQGLTYRPSGAVVAAATTSLPEQLGGDRNYDYRFAWLRDFSYTLHALWVAACTEETSRHFGWAVRSAGRLGIEPAPIMYGVGSERDLSEHVLDHLGGYAGSRPVRTGNDAWRQRQLDVPGEVLEAAYLLRDRLGQFDEELRQMLVDLAHQTVDIWHRPDAGMWEIRGEQRHYTSSKVGCWVALDRAVRLAPRLGEGADPRRWAAARDEIHRTVLEQGWNERVEAFTGAFGSDELDASVLLMPLVNFLPATDGRMRATIEAIERELATDGVVRRSANEPAGFVWCSFWLVGCLVLAGDNQRATELFERTSTKANDLGIFAEQIDLVTGEHLGNTPQALSHIGQIIAAARLTDPTMHF